MDRRTEANREWLDRRFAFHQGEYVAHQPIYGFRRGPTEGGHIRRFCRTLNLFRSLLPLQPASILDVGGAEGYLMSIARHLTGAEVVTTDLSVAACLRAREFWGLRTAALDAADLPFVDDAFDVVVSSEVIEHLTYPFHTLAELIRVARRYVLLTTEAAFAWSLYRRAHLWTRNPNEPHFDRNFFTPDDFRRLFGSTCVIRPQFSLLALAASDTDLEIARRRVLSAASPLTVSATTQGVIVIVSKRGEPIPPPQRSRDEEVLEILFRGPLEACPRQEERWTPSLLARARCPDCGGALTFAPTDRVTCQRCCRTFGSFDGVLTLFREGGQEAPRTQLVQPDEKAAVYRLTADPASRAYLLRLVRALEPDQIAGTPVRYTACRCLRWLLGRARWLLCLWD